MKLKHLALSLLITIIEITCNAQSYNAIPNGTRTITSCSGNLYDHGGASGDYSNSSNDTIIIKPNATGKVVQIKLQSMSLDNLDNVIYLSGLDEIKSDGTKTNYVLFYDSGVQGAQTNFHRSRNSDGTVTLIFGSNEAGTSSGFHYSIGCYTLPVTPEEVKVPKTGHVEILTCNKEIFDDGGSKGNYSDNSDGSITILPSLPNQKISLQIGNFYTGNFDEFSIYDGDSVNSNPLLVNFYGTFTNTTNKTKFTANNPKGALTIKFKSNSSVNTSGFSFTTSCTSFSYSNPDSIIPFSGSKTVITCDEKFYPYTGSSKYYFDNSDGHIVIKPNSANEKIKLSIERFNFYRNTQDTLFLYDGEFIDSPILAELISPPPVGQFYVPTNEKGIITARFKSNNSITSEGFVLHATCFSDVTSIDNESIINNRLDEFALSPNPAIGNYITINKDIKNVEAISLNGQKTKLEIANNQSVIVNNLEKGIYFLNIETKTGEFYHKKMIKE